MGHIRKAHDLFEKSRNEKIQICYTTIDFIEDLRSKLGEQLGTKSYDKVSEFLEMNSRFLWDIVKKIKYSNWKHYNPDYQFSKEILNDFKGIIIKKLGENGGDPLKLIEKYIRINKNLKDYSGQQYQIKFPRFFREIDSKKKAYWLGFLTADGFINKITKRIGIEVSIKDRNQLVKFCESIGLNTDRIYKKIKKLQYKGEEKEYQHVWIEFGCKPMLEDLILMNFWDEKKEKKKMRIPNLMSRELKLAWLLGYYDGDGIQDRTKICSTNNVFLEQIKELFQISHEVILERQYEEYKDLEGKIHKRKPFYSLTLGSKLFNEMMNNYNKSLKRKRRYFKELNEALDNLKEKLKNKEELQKLVLMYRRFELIEMYDTSAYIFDKLIKHWHIHMPDIGYWNLEKHRNSYKKFILYFKKNPNSKNHNIYEAFPDISESTLRRWKRQLINEGND